MHIHRYTYIVYSLMIMYALMLISCGSVVGGGERQAPEVDFGNPQEVTITGYAGDAMEPFISRDGSTLFFNNRDTATLPGGAENDTNVHYATRVDDATFTYEGEVTGANTDDVAGTNEYEGNVSMDEDDTIFFVNTTDYWDESSPNYLLSMFRASYANGTLTDIESLPNLRVDRDSGDDPVPGEMNFDLDVTEGGVYLYFAEGKFNEGEMVPYESNLGSAMRLDEDFVAQAGAAFGLSAVNTDALEYGPSITSSRLELYFTRASGSDVGIYVATRPTVSDAWENVKRLTAITGDMTEAPSISADGSLLYYHQKISDVYKIYVVERQ